MFPVYPCPCTGPQPWPPPPTFKLVQLGPHCTGPPSDMYNLFIMSHVWLQAGGWRPTGMLSLF